MKDEVSKKKSHKLDRKGTHLSDVILGGQDGLVNVLGVILGVAAASQDTRIVLAGGLAATFAESISMAAVAYTSKIAERDYYFKELEKEKYEIEQKPDVQQDKIRHIYRQKGFDAKMLEDIVKVITSNKRIWLETIMSDDLKLSYPDEKRPYLGALIVGVSALIGSLIPLFPFFFSSIQSGMYYSLAISALTLFIVGAVKARLTIGNLARSGLQMAIIGIISALAGYAVGLLFNVQVF